MRGGFHNSFKLGGRVHKLYDRQQVNPNFAKRELVLAVAKTAALGPEISPKLIKIEFAQEMMAELDSVQLGQEITVHFTIEGRTWERNQETQYLVVLSGWRIESEDATGTAYTGLARPEPMPTAGPRDPSEPGPFDWLPEKP
jgi:hypothetical protein